MAQPRDVSEEVGDVSWCGAADPETERLPLCTGGVFEQVSFWRVRAQRPTQSMKYFA